MQGKVCGTFLSIPVINQLGCRFNPHLRESFFFSFLNLFEIRFLYTIITDVSAFPMHVIDSQATV